MKIGLGGLRYTPEVFWNLSLLEFTIACEGYAESKGVRSTGPHGPPLKTSELDELMAAYPDVEGSAEPA